MSPTSYQAAPPRVSAVNLDRDIQVKVAEPMSIAINGRCANDRDRNPSPS